MLTGTDLNEDKAEEAVGDGSKKGPTEIQKDIGSIILGSRGGTG